VSWWWTRRKCKNTEGIAAAEHALEREKQAGADAEAKRQTAEEVASETARHRRENNFSRLIEEAMHQQRRSP
jgi:hypothetical protein